MILNNPSNPTGMMYSRSELEAIAKVCVENDLYVISDEIYYHLVYDNEEFVSLAAISPEVKERTLLINGVSKSYAMTGWRIGYVAAPAHISKLIGNYLSHCISSPCSISQKAAAAALSGSQETVEDMREGVRGAPQLHGGPHEPDRGRQLHSAPRRLLCDDEH